MNADTVSSNVNEKAGYKLSMGLQIMVPELVPYIK